MTTKTQNTIEKTVSIHPNTRLGPISLTVADLDRSVTFHQTVLGFKLHWREGVQAGLGAGQEDIFLFTEVRGARPARRTTGLYHTAILVPTKYELAQLIKRIAETRAPIQGSSNHGTHLAVYLADAEGNGMELAWDFPREQWPNYADFATMDPREAQRILSGPFDPVSLLREVGPDLPAWTGLAAGTKVGHVHLHVSDLASTRQFYQRLLGFDNTIHSDEAGMSFFSAGGYHHHIGTNIWNGAGAPPPPAGSTGLRHFTIVLPDQTEMERVTHAVQQAGIETTPTQGGILLHDPSQNAILLTVESADRSG